MIFSSSKALPWNLSDITSSQYQGPNIECVASSKYLSILFDSHLSFKLHIDELISKLKLNISFYYYSFRNRTLFSFTARKYLVSATSLPLLDFRDLLHMNAQYTI